MGNLELNDEQDEIKASGGHGYILLYLDDRPSMRWRFYKSMRLKLVLEGTKKFPGNKEIVSSVTSGEREKPHLNEDVSPYISDLENDDHKQDNEATSPFSLKETVGSNQTCTYVHSLVFDHEESVSFQAINESKTDPSLVEASEYNDVFNVALALGSDADENMCDGPETDLKMNSLKSVSAEIEDYQNRSINAIGVQVLDVPIEEVINDLSENTKFVNDTFDDVHDQEGISPIHNAKSKFSKDSKTKKGRAENSESMKLKKCRSAKPIRTCDLCKEPFHKRADHYELRPAKNLKCPACHRIFGSEAELLVHKYLRHKCTGTEAKEGSDSVLKEVELQKHIPWRKRVLSCPLCDAKICYPKLVEHIKCQHTNESSFSCCLCKQEFSRWKMLKEHMNTHLGIENSRGKWHCSLCPEVFSSSNEFLRHSHCHRRTCVFCKKDFKFLRLLNIHYKKEHYDSLLPCSICGHRVATKKQLWTHERYHKYKNPIPCHICGKLFRRSFMRQHILRTHRDKTKAINNDEVSASGAKNFLCSMCPQTFNSEGYLIRHLNTTHKQTIGIQCPLCHKRFQNREKAREHVRKHTLEPKIK